MRGRTALYGRRHLLQLVAIKCLQATGIALAELQRQLLGLTDAELARVAKLPAAVDDGDGDVGCVPERPSQPFWMDAQQLSKSEILRLRHPGCPCRASRSEKA